MNKTTRIFLGLILAVAALAVAALAGGIGYWQHAAKFRGTENAYINADVVQVASQLSGPVLAVHVREGQLVKGGQALFDIDPAPYRVALEQAKAKLAQAEQGGRQDLTGVSATDAGVRQAQADLVNARATAQRAQNLVQKNYMARQAADDAQARVKVAEAALAQAQARLAGARVQVARVGDATPAVLAARAAVAQAELDLKRTHAVAEKEGWVVNLKLVPGSSVSAYMPLFAMVARGSFWVDANFKETEIPGIEPGQPAEVEIDMLPGQRYRGTVDIINNGTGAAFSLLPAQNATGNWVKVTQRIPVRIRFAGADADQPFRVGASAHVTVRVGN